MLDQSLFRMFQCMNEVFIFISAGAEFNVYWLLASWTDSQLEYAVYACGEGTVECKSASV